ncbi:conserved telomere maintenance component 1 [Wolffia australiana]
MAERRIVFVAELLRNGASCTGASSFFSDRNDQSTFFGRAPLAVEGSSLGFRALDFPAVLVGVLGLSIENGDAAEFCCAGNRCLSFSDETGRICCEVLDLDLAIIGTEICVLAWNFVPLSRDRGVLELIRWRLIDRVDECRDRLFSPASLPSQFPLMEVYQRVRSCAWGVLVAVSPVFSVPFSVQKSRRNRDVNEEGGAEDDGSYLDGFLTELYTCNCRFCEKFKSVNELQRSLIDQNFHSFDVQVFVYFHGHCSSWRPILSKLLTNLVTISGLKKKYISSGESERLMFVTTERTSVHKCGKTEIPGFERRRRVLSRREFLVGSYCGVISGIFNDGMIVELDKRNVWLLLAAPHLDRPHSLRIGALILVKNVLFIHPSFSWIEMLLLGSSIRTSIEVKSFSVVDTRCHFVPRRQRRLWNFIFCLPFHARFWATMVSSSFQKKFAGALSDKEILGTRKVSSEGGIGGKFLQIYSTFNSFSARGAFEDFCGNHDFSLGSSSNDVPLTMPVPLSNFIAKCVKHWISTPTNIQLEAKTSWQEGHTDQFYILRKYHQWMSTQTISSDELGVILVGFLQVSPSSGRLQLMDSTGCVDVVMLGSQRRFDPHVLYEVKEYKIVLCGFPLQLDQGIFYSSDPLSCRSIFQEFDALKEDHDLHISIHFVEARNLRTLGSSFPHRAVVVDRAESGVFDLLLTTHKFPKIPNRKNAFAEVILVSYSLIIKPRHGRILQCADDSSQGTPCLITFTGAGTTYEAHLTPREHFSASKPTHSLRRILLEFEPQAIDLHQGLSIGEAYILKRPSDDLRVENPAKSVVNSLWSVDLHHSDDEYVEARLRLPGHWIGLVRDILEEAKTMRGEILTVRSLLQISAPPPSVTSTSCGRFPHKGKLVSLRGDVAESHVLQRNGNRDLCVHVCDGALMVKVRGGLSKSLLICGLGPGTNATFHRVLAQPNSAGRYDLVMVPVSTVEVNYVNRPETLPQPSDSAAGVMRSGVLISELSRLADRTRVGLGGRVAGVVFLTLEGPTTPRSAVGVPLAGFILDDGSSVCCCWADSGRARTMLRLEESCRESLTGEDPTPVNVRRALRRILRKHRRVTATCFGSNVSADSGGDIVYFDQRLVKWLVLRAINGPSLRVAARLVNPEALTCLPDGFSGSDLARESVTHVWAEEVDLACALSEARSLINERL